jgi:hypothetical protein
VFESLRAHFARCTRSFVELSDPLKACLRERNMGNRGHVEYKVHAPAAGSYKARRDDAPGRRPWDTGDETRTGAYLIYQKFAWPNGPALLTAFGMSGPLTLLWAHFLGTRKEFSSVLSHSRFLMAEFEIQSIPRKAESLAFADNWKVDVLLDCPLD